MKMCRILLCNYEGFVKLEEIYGVEKMLYFLERNCGGHGNGYMVIKDKKIKNIDKGVKLTNHKIYSKVSGKPMDYFIYHTRVSSAGSVSNKNCHPFWNKKKSFALCMNGTERSMADIGRNLDKTDTEIIFDMVNRSIIPLKALGFLNANYMGFRNGKVFVVNNNRFNCLEVYQDGNAFVIASTFPKDFPVDTKDMELTTWYEGEDIPIREPINFQSNFDNNSNFYYYEAPIPKGWKGVCTYKPETIDFTKEDIYKEVLKEEYEK
jgi:predicted glutamine amidotransferase